MPHEQHSLMRMILVLAALTQAAVQSIGPEAALRTALTRYLAIAAEGGWPSSLAQRLASEGYDTTGELLGAVRHFQKLHGLQPDGIVGPATQRELDISPAARARQIELNLERWRWLPRDLGQRYIVVNSAAFVLQVVENDSIIFKSRVVVGRADWPTPVVSATATHIVFRPTWNIPRKIAMEEVWPLIRRDSTYARRMKIRILGDSQLVQEPGPRNPLGGMKLVFWTPFDVFIHDTPFRASFDKHPPTFSHGCVRVEHAAELAELLVGWPPDSVQAAMREGRPRLVRLPRPIPVHLVYWTAWVSEDGLVAFAGDPYGWDEALGRQLDSVLR